MNNKWFRKNVWLLVFIFGIVVLVIWILTLPKKSDVDLVASSGIHWHSKLNLKIKDKTITIPANVGLGAAHSPIHTHDEDSDKGVIHMEFPGHVRKDDLRIKNFFDVWEKDFSKDMIFEYKSGNDGRVKMFVNGEENFEFENYQMRDGDVIEIIYQ